MHAQWSRRSKQKVPSVFRGEAESIIARLFAHERPKGGRRSVEYRCSASIEGLELKFRRLYFAMKQEMVARAPNRRDVSRTIGVRLDGL